MSWCDEGLRWFQGRKVQVPTFSHQFRCPLELSQREDGATMARHTVGTIQDWLDEAWWTLSESDVHESCEVKIDSDYRSYKPIFSISTSSTVMLPSCHVGYKYPSKTWPPAPPIEEMWKEKTTCHNLAKNKLSNFQTFPFFSFPLFSSSHIKQMWLVIVYTLLHVSYVTKFWGHEVTAEQSAYDSNSLASLVIYVKRPVQDLDARRPWNLDALECNVWAGRDDSSGPVEWFWLFFCACHLLYLHKVTAFIPDDRWDSGYLWSLRV